MDMWKDRIPVGLLLRLSILLTAVCLGVHLYLDTSWQGSPAPLASGRPIHSDQNREQQTRMIQVSAEALEQDKNFKISFLQALKRDSQARRKDRDHEDLLSPLQPRRKQTPRWHIDLQPWASESQSLEDEAKRFLSYITTPQVSCASLAGAEGAGDWAVCLDPKYSLIHRIQSKHCRVYSFGLGVDNKSLERLLSGSGCEVHCFDPGLEQPHLQKASMWFHRLSVHWRDPNPAVAAKHQYANTKKLATIFNDFGHRDVDVLKADMESAEWKILENLVLEGVLDSVGQLLLELHLHWAGFEVSGNDPSVVRYWFSLLKELERANFRLFRVHSNPARPHLFLHKNVLNASSAYTLSWVNTQRKPSRMPDKNRQ
ncbi:methyltransferase-like protein 24 [Kryptolebias marmoratus]|uniref:Methyltransferase like 24 n=1 Tax=Kryptolebias marmoratus TaxID=37003 RepID=A0A3Q3ASD6_KRYMA|nr:methyltransferase-like protein 24 [Kryptolebias marmoratus]